MTHPLLEKTYAEFLQVPTPEAWVEHALEHLDVLLIDHAHCEKKAASTAINLLFRYPEKTTLCHQMSRLAREELRHFEQVLSHLTVRNISYGTLQPSRYAAGLRAAVANHEPQRCIDILIVGAYIEARSCERFAALLPHLASMEPELHGFYKRLVASESRHFRNYLGLALEYSREDITARVQLFGEQEAELITSPDPQFRFHSGVPANTSVALEK